MEKRTIALGLDFGTESARAILVDTKTGEELITIVGNYPHGVLDELLPDGNTLSQSSVLRCLQYVMEIRPAHKKNIDQFTIIQLDVGQ